MSKRELAALLKVQILAGRTRSAAREKMMTSSPDHGAAPVMSFSD